MNYNKERYDVKSISIKIEDRYPLLIPKKFDYIIPKNQISKETANHIFFKHSKLGSLVKYKLDNRIENMEGYLSELNGELTETTQEVDSTTTDGNPLEDFFNLQGERINIKERYLPEDLIIKSVEDVSQNHILIAPTNTGKTSTLIKYLINQNAKFIYLVPLRYLAKQDAAKYGIKLYLGGIKDKILAMENRDEAQTTIDNCLPIITTYDSFIGTIHDLIRDKFNWILVIDEYHKLISDSGFRNTQLVKLNGLKRNYKKFIGLTGTPYGAIDSNNLRKENVKVINFVFDSFKQNVQNYNLIYADVGITTEKHLKLFASYVIKNIRNGISIIYINNKVQLCTLFDFIFTQHIFPETAMKVYTADTNEDPELEKAVECENFDIKEGEKLLIFTTSALSTGLNFNDLNFSDLYTFHENNLIELIQLINRFRNGIERIHDFVIKNDRSEVINYSASLSQRLTMFYRINEEINQMLKYKILEFSYLSNSEIGNKKSILNDNSLLFINNESIVNSLYIYYRVLNEFHKQIYYLPILRKEYLERYKFENIELINLEKLKLKPIAEDEKFRNNLLKKFMDNRDFLLEINDASLDNIDYNNEPLLSLLKHQKMIDIIESYKFYLEKYNFSSRFALALIKKENYENIFNSLQYIWYLKNKNINETSKTEFRNNKSAVLEIDKIIKSFGSGIIDWKIVKKVLRSLPKNAIVSYFLTGPRLRYSIIYKLRNKDKYFDYLKNGSLLFQALKIEPAVAAINTVNAILEA